MDLLALVLSVEETRRQTHSALPHARVSHPSDRWQRVRAVIRRLVRRRSDASKAGEPALRVASRS